MFRWLFGRRKDKDAASDGSARRSESVSRNTETDAPRPPNQAATGSATEPFTPAMEEEIRRAAPLNLEKAEALAKQFGGGVTARSVAAKAVRMGVAYERKGVSTAPREGAQSCAQSQARPAPATPPRSRSTTPSSKGSVYIGVYCTELRYFEDDDTGAALPSEFAKAQREWLKSRNDANSPHYTSACDTLSRCFTSELSMVDSLMSVSYEVGGSGRAKKGREKFLSPAEAVRSLFKDDPKLIGVEVVAADFREEPNSSVYESGEELNASPDVAVLAIYEATLSNPDPVDRVQEKLNLNEELIRECFSLGLKPHLTERTEVDEDGYEFTYTGFSYNGGDLALAVASGPKGQAREQLISRVREERAALFGEEEDSPIKRILYLADEDALRRELANGVPVGTLIDGQPLLKLSMITIAAADTLYKDSDYSDELKASFASVEDYKAAAKRMVLQLLDAGADVNQPAGEHSITTVAEILNDSDITARVRAQSGGQGNEIALLVAAERGDHERVQELLSAGTPVDTALFKGTTPLMMAAQGPGGEDAPPLAGAERTAQEKTVKLLLKAGADVNAKAHDGNTALGNAVRRGNTSIAKILIEAGAKAVGALPGNASITEMARRKKDRA